MNNSKKFGIIGKNISYSFSKKYFTNKFRKLMLDNHFYETYDIADISEIENVLNTPNLVGVNVTIPYKEKVIEFLNELSEEAQKIGAINTILIKNGKKIGYNTDAIGFEKSFLLMKKKTPSIGTYFRKWRRCKSRTIRF